MNLEFCGKCFSLEFFQLTSCTRKEGVSGRTVPLSQELVDKHLKFCLFKMGGTVSRQGVDSITGDDFLQRILFFCQHALWQENGILPLPFTKESDFCLCPGLKPFGL